MKRFLKNFAIFALLFVAFDFAIGSVLHSLYFRQTSGDGARLTYALREASEDVIIFGDSRAYHHYDPAALSEAMSGLSCYNTGEAAQSVLFSTAVEHVLLDRHTPRVAVLDINPICLLKNPVDYDKLASLLPYASDFPAVAKVVDLRSWAEAAKRRSRMYTFNSTVFSILNHNRPSDGFGQGFVPLEGEMDEEQIRQAAAPTEPPSQTKIDPAKLDALRAFIDKARKQGCPVVLVASPIYNIGAESEQLAEIRRLLDRDDVPFLDHLEDPVFLGNSSLFHDRAHLNAEGARRFSQSLGREVLPLLEEATTG